MLKYARFSHATEFETFVFTGPPLKLSTLADVMRERGYTPISAGFVQFGPAGQITTHGESVSLDLAPLPDDATRIYLLYVHTPIGNAERVRAAFADRAEPAVTTTQSA